MIWRALILTLICAVAAPAARAEVLVFAAASLKDPLDRMAAEFDDLVVSYGGSGTLARQVTLGAPADVVLLANVAWMDVLIEGGHVQPDTVEDFASNTLVMVGRADIGPVVLEVQSVLAALDGGRLAIGLTEAVPAGIYAKAALQSLDLWVDLAPHLAEVDSVTSALALVSRGQTPLGIVYRSDVELQTDVVELAVFPPESHPPIRYQGGLIDGQNAQALAFWNYVQGPQGQAILAQSGFLPPLGLPQ